MSFNIRKSIAFYCKSSYVLLVVAACSVGLNSEKAEATVKNTKVPGVSSTARPGSRISTSSIGSGISNGDPFSSSLAGVSSISGSKSSISSSSSGKSSSLKTSGVKISSIASDPIKSPVSHKYGVSSDDFDINAAGITINPNKEYVQFIDKSGKVITKEKSLISRLGLLLTQDEIGRDTEVDKKGKPHQYIYRTQPNWIKGSDIISSKNSKGVGSNDTTSISSQAKGRNTATTLDKSTQTSENGVTRIKPISQQSMGVDVKQKNDVTGIKGSLSGNNVSSQDNGLGTLYTSRLKIKLNTEKNDVDKDKNPIHKISIANKNNTQEKEKPSASGSKVYKTELNIDKPKTIVIGLKNKKDQDVDVNSHKSSLEVKLSNSKKQDKNERNIIKLNTNKDKSTGRVEPKPVEGGKTDLKRDIVFQSGAEIKSSKSDYIDIKDPQKAVIIDTGIGSTSSDKVKPKKAKAKTKHIDRVEPKPVEGGKTDLKRDIIGESGLEIRYAKSDYVDIKDPQKAVIIDGDSTTSGDLDKKKGIKNPIFTEEEIAKAKDGLKPITIDKEQKKENEENIDDIFGDAGIKGLRSKLNIQSKVNINSDEIIKGGSKGGIVKVFNKFYEIKSEEEKKPLVSNQKGIIDIKANIEEGKVTDIVVDKNITSGENNIGKIDMDPNILISISKSVLNAKERHEQNIISSGSSVVQLSDSVPSPSTGTKSSVSLVNKNNTGKDDSGKATAEAVISLAKSKLEEAQKNGDHDKVIKIKGILSKLSSQDKIGS